MAHNTKTCLFKYTKILPPKNKMKIFQINNSDIFHISAQNIDCGYSLELPQWGSSNEYPQSMFLSRNKKNNVYPCKHQFYYIKVGFKRVKIIWVCFEMEPFIITLLSSQYDLNNVESDVPQQIIIMEWLTHTYALTHAHQLVMAWLPYTCINGNEENICYLTN